MISDKNLLNFKFPPDLPSFKPKQRKKYTHHVIVSSKDKLIPYEELRELAIGVLSNDEKSTKDFADYFVPTFQLNFRNDKEAKAYKNAADKATNGPIVEYEKKEVPVTNEEGVIL